MDCLQCGKTAKETGEVFDKAPIRECEDGHRTALASKALIKRTEKWKKLGKIELDSELFIQEKAA